MLPWGLTGSHDLFSGKMFFPWFFTPCSSIVPYESGDKLRTQWPAQRLRPRQSLDFAAFSPLFPIHVTSTQNKAFLPPFPGHLPWHWGPQRPPRTALPRGRGASLFHRLLPLLQRISIQRQLCPQGDTSQFLKTFLVVISRGVSVTNSHRCCWHLESRPVMLLTSCKAQVRPRQELSVKNVNGAEAKELAVNERECHSYKHCSTFIWFPRGSLTVCFLTAFFFFLHTYNFGQNL